MTEVSPARRSRVIREAHAAGAWSGILLGHRAELTVNHASVEWRVCVRRHWIEGDAADVWHALEAIGSAVQGVTK